MVMNSRYRFTVMFVCIATIVLSTVNVALALDGWHCGQQNCSGMSKKSCIYCCDNHCGFDTFGCQGFCIGDPEPPEDPS
jgi:hypothetical protein